MAPYYATFGFVVEDGEASGVLSRPWWLGVSSFDELVLLATGPPVEVVVAHVAADEVVVV